MNRRNNLIIGGVIATAVLGAVGAVTILQPDGIKLENPQKLVWDKPTTDAEWAEDVKKENFDIKSTGVLQTMIESHIAKLAREETAFKKFVEMKATGQDPVQYLYWGWLENLQQTYPNESKLWYESEALKQAQEQYDRELWSIEKLKQSIERMNKEVELRAKGFVLVEGEKTGLFGASVPPERIRHIND